MMKHMPTTTQNGIIRCVLMLKGKSSFKMRKNSKRKKSYLILKFFENVKKFTLWKIIIISDYVA